MGQNVTVDVVNLDVTSRQQLILFLIGGTRISNIDLPPSAKLFINKEKNFHQEILENLIAIMFSP